MFLSVTTTKAADVTLDLRRSDFGGTSVATIGLQLIADGSLTKL